MDRRRSLKYIVTGAVASGFVLAACGPEESQKLARVLKKVDNPFTIGRTTEELKRDAALVTGSFFTAEEEALINVLADIIIPADDTYGAATDTHVFTFIDFMALDKPEFQVRLRGGLQWINQESRRRFGK